MPDNEAELLLVTARPGLEPDLVVESAALAARRWTEAGGEVVAEPAEIAIGSRSSYAIRGAIASSCSIARKASCSPTTRAT
jgi:hypothetical protein